jgi:hypothetical protein
MQEEEQETGVVSPDVLPPHLRTALIVLWVALFGGRWLLIPALLAAGAVSAPDMDRLDGGILLQIYLVLLVITVLVAVLRAVRSVQAAPTSGPRASLRRGDPRD